MLVLRGYSELPPHSASAFDHGDVYRATGRVFIAHTAANSVEALDGDTGAHEWTVPGCPEASGVLCAQDEGIVFAAARGAGKVLVIEASAGAVLREIAVGPQPNGLAWDTERKGLLVADVQENQAWLVDPLLSSPQRPPRRVTLPGRPRWCVYDSARSRFLVNIREPACVAILSADGGEQMAQWPVSASGPHGLDLDMSNRRAFVACDEGMVVALDLDDGHELDRVPIAGAPDAVWYNSRRQRLYVAIEHPGVVDAINTVTMTLDEETVTEVGAHTTAFDVERRRLYVFLPETCRVALYEEYDEPDDLSWQYTADQLDRTAVLRWEGEGGALDKRKEV